MEEERIAREKEDALRKQEADDARRELEEKERIKREKAADEARLRKEQEERKIEEAKKTIHDSGKALGRNATSAM